MEIAEIKKTISQIDYKGSDVRSASFAIRRVLNAVLPESSDVNTSSAAWDIAREVKKVHGAEFTKQHVKDLLESFLKRHGIEVANPDKSSQVNFQEVLEKFTPEDQEVIKDDSLKKNEKMRRLLKGEYSKADIARAVGVTRQRVVNVQKQEKAKNAKLAQDNNGDNTK